MMPKKLLIYFCIFISLHTFSQKEISNLDYKELKSRFFNNVNNKSKQKIYAKAILEKAKKENNIYYVIRGYYFHSLIYKGDTAIKYLDTVIQHSINTDDENFPNSAYCEKAALLEEQFKYNEALENYLLAEKYALANKKTDNYYVARFFIAGTKSENLGEVQEALSIYKEIFNHYKKSNVRSNYSEVIYQKAIFGIADTFKALRETDSASFYNRLGYKESIKNNVANLSYLFKLNEGANLVIKNNYKVALDSVKEAIVDIKKYNDKPNLMASYFYLGKIYNGLGKTNMAIESFLKVDSIHSSDKIMYPELIEGYHYLIAHYKKQGNKEKQLEFLNKYISIDSIFQKNHNHMYKLLVKEYDIPNLVRDKENLIKSLKGYNNFFLLSFIVFLLTTIGLAYYQHNIKIKYKTRFKQIIEKHQTKINAENSNEKKIETEDTNTIKKTPLVPNEVEIRILDRLLEFEQQKKFLNKNITLQSLSKDIETNTVYLSKSINTFKEKKFNDYINDLRIDECVKQLQENKELLKYTVEAIAKEFGFNNEDTFSNAFQKRVKLKPSFFINELKSMLKIS